jgi:hypothetical protein
MKYQKNEYGKLIKFSEIVLNKTPKEWRNEQTIERWRYERITTCSISTRFSASIIKLPKTILRH